MKETYKKSWEQAAVEYSFLDLVTAMLALEDDTSQREFIARHPITMSHAFSTYCLDLEATWKEDYGAAIAAVKQKGGPTADDKVQLKKLQHDLKQIKVIGKTTTSVCVQNYFKDHPPPTPPPPVPPAAPARPAAAARDPRLVGQWEYSTYSSANGFSFSRVRTRLLKRDGRFVEGGQISANLTHHDMYGNETGMTSADSGAPADERGSWQTNNDVLRLDWDSGDYATFRVDLGADGMLLTPIEPPGKAKYWAKMA